MEYDINLVGRTLVIAGVVLTVAAFFVPVLQIFAAIYILILLIFLVIIQVVSVPVGGPQSSYWPDWAITYREKVGYDKKQRRRMNVAVFAIFMTIVYLIFLVSILPSRLFDLTLIGWGMFFLTWFLMVLLN